MSEIPVSVVLRSFTLVNIICLRLRNSFTVGYISDLMTINVLEKELADWDATLSNHD